jgi:hypothetical protein
LGSLQWARAGLLAITAYQHSSNGYFHNTPTPLPGASTLRFTHAGLLQAHRMHSVFDLKARVLKTPKVAMQARSCLAGPTKWDTHAWQSLAAVMLPHD